MAGSHRSKKPAQPSTARKNRTPVVKRGTLKSSRSATKTRRVKSPAKAVKKVMSKRQSSKRVGAAKLRSLAAAHPSNATQSGKIASPGTVTSQPAPKQREATLTISELSPGDRYNAGGLCASLIDPSAQDGKALLMRVLSHLGLSAQEQTNLFRLALGVTMPNLFADAIKGEEIRWTVYESVFSVIAADRHYEMRWKNVVESLAFLLGISPPRAAMAAKLG